MVTLGFVAPQRALHCAPALPRAPGVGQRRGCERRLTVRASTGRGWPWRVVDLPGGAGTWLAGLPPTEQLVFGPDFVLQRPSAPRPGQPGLVRRPAPPKPQRWAPPAPPAAAGALVPAQAPRAASLALPVYDIAAGAVVIDTDFEVTEVKAAAVGAGALSSKEGLDGGSCLSIVPVTTGLAAEDEEGEEAGAAPGGGRHPRRTLLVRFRCNLCRTPNTSLVNPHAWSAGSVFCRCGGCAAVHKLADNLNIFYESQAAFPPPELRRTLLSPEVLEAAERLRRLAEN